MIEQNLAVDRKRLKDSLNMAKMAAQNQPSPCEGKMNTEQLNELLVEEIKDIYNAENQLVKALPACKGSS